MGIAFAPGVLFGSIPNRRGEHPFRIARMSAIDAGIHAIRAGRHLCDEALRYLWTGTSRRTHRTQRADHANRTCPARQTYSNSCLLYSRFEMIQFWIPNPSATRGSTSGVQRPRRPGPLER
jgi:hypothetical protein